MRQSLCLKCNRHINLPCHWQHRYKPGWCCCDVLPKAQSVAAVPVARPQNCRIYAQRLRTDRETTVSGAQSVHQFYAMLLALAGPYAAWLTVVANMVSAIGVVVISKLVWQQWPYVATLCTLHTVSVKVVTYLMRRNGLIDDYSIPLRPTALIALLVFSSVLLTNMNLFMSSLTVHQASIMLVVPLTALLEYMLLGTKPSRPALLCACIIVLGIAAAVDLAHPPSVTLAGGAVASGSILTASCAAVLATSMQNQLKASSLQLLDAQHSIVVVFMSSVALWTDGTRGFTEALQLPVTAMALLLATCVMVVLLNVSNAHVSGTAPSRLQQLLLHNKVALTLVLGFPLLDERLTTLQIFGFLLSTAGMIAYGQTRDAERAWASGKMDPVSMDGGLHVRSHSSLPVQSAVRHMFGWDMPLSRIVAATTFVGACGAAAGFLGRYKTLDSSERGRHGPVGLPVTWDVIVCGHARQDAHLLRDWVLWNHVAGIQHFVLFDNSDLLPGGLKDEFDAAVSPLVEAGLVTVHKFHKDIMNKPELADKWGLDRKQYESLRMDIDNPLKDRCYEMYHHRAKWIAFLDTDEVFVSLQEGLTLPKFLAKPEIAENMGIGGVGIFWRIVQYSGHFLRPPQSSFEHFRLCEAHVSDRHIKSIVRGSGGGIGGPSLAMCANAHYMDYKPGWKCVNEVDLTEAGCSIADLRDPNRWQRPPSRHFQINHHFGRSLEDFLAKSLRGMYFRADQDKVRMDFAVHSMCNTIDHAPTNAAAQKVRDLRTQLKIPPGPEPAPLPPMSPAMRDRFPLLAVLYDAVIARRVFDEVYYRTVGANRTECVPQPPADGLLHFWSSGYTAGCPFRFK